MESGLIFDTHAHYDDEAFGEDRDVLLSSLRENGIGNVVNVCASVGHFDRTISLTEKYPFVYGAVGVHPDDAALITDEVLSEIRALAKREKVVAVGEIGLDYYWHKDPAEHEIQKEKFRAQMDIARETQLPFMIHSRDACEDTLEIVKEYMGRGGMRGGILHCYSYGKETAREYVKMGLFIGVGGVVTFKNGRKLKETVAETPLTQIVLETDCPYLAPEPFRGKRNSSLNLKYVVSAIAAIKELPEEEVRRVTQENARRLLEI